MLPYHNKYGKNIFLNFIENNKLSFNSHLNFIKETTKNLNMSSIFIVSLYLMSDSQDLRMFRARALKPKLQKYVLF